MIYNNTLEMIGNTPVLKLSKLTDETMADVYVKLEGANPAGSVKDRAALGMIEAGEAAGALKPGMTIVEPTSGNTGIAIAMIGKLKGYKTVIVMPETMSVERRKMIKAYGAELILTEGGQGMRGAINRAEEMLENGDVFIPSQFDNEANPMKHYETTAEEIFKDIPDIDAFIAGVGTGGTITGVGKKLKALKKDVKIVAVEPEQSAVLSGGQPGPHKIQGIGAGFEPEIYNGEFVDEVRTIHQDDVFNAGIEVAAKEGLLLGISAVGNVLAAIELAKDLGPGKKVVTIAPDGGEKYLSTGLFGNGN
ncbi:cysteine synthase A [Fusibacter sp. JL216-2]|uniref:cysteine synthase A n=1 Tax=Fusibacter sp. JL216-2 TaxID=3071453 RepID=UPI003D33548F